MQLGKGGTQKNISLAVLNSLYAGYIHQCMQMSFLHGKIAPVGKNYAFFKIRTFHASPLSHKNISGHDLPHPFQNTEKICIYHSIFLRFRQ